MGLVNHQSLTVGRSDGDGGEGCGGVDGGAGDSDGGGDGGGGDVGGVDGGCGGGRQILDNLLVDLVRECPELLIINKYGSHKRRINLGRDPRSTMCTVSE